MFKKRIPFQYDEELKRELDLRGRSYGTYKNYRSQLRRMSEHLSIDEAKGFLYHLKNSLHHQPQTINLCRAAYRFFRHNVLGEYVAPDLLPIHKFVYQLPDILSTNEVLLVFEHLSLKYRAVLSLCYGSGLRIAEALSRDWRCRFKKHESLCPVR